MSHCRGASSSKVKSDKDDFFTSVCKLVSIPKEKRVAFMVCNHSLSQAQGPSKSLYRVSRARIDKNKVPHCIAVGVEESGILASGESLKSLRQ